MSFFLDLFIKQLNEELKDKLPNHEISGTPLEKAQYMMVHGLWYESRIMKARNRGPHLAVSDTEMHAMYFNALYPLLCHDHHRPLYLRVSDELGEQISGMTGDTRNYSELLSEHKSIYMEFPYLMCHLGEYVLRAVILRDVSYSVAIHSYAKQPRVRHIHDQKQGIQIMALLSRGGENECNGVLWEEREKNEQECTLYNFGASVVLNAIDHIVIQYIHSIINLVSTYNRYAPERARTHLRSEDRSIISFPSKLLEKVPAKRPASLFPFILLEKSDDPSFLTEGCGFVATHLTHTN